MKTYKEYLKEAGNVHLAYYLEAADILGIQYKVLVRKLLAKFTYQDKSWYIINTATPLTNSPSSTIAKRKYLTNLVLTEAGLPVPKQVPLNSPVDAIKFFDTYKRIAIKPAQQLGGIGITLLPNSEQDVINAFNVAKEKNLSKSSTKVLGEEFLEGENYRLLVVGNKVIGAVRRKAAHIVGDGKHTIQELIDISNEERKKDILKPIKIDNEVKLRLKELNMTLDSIPKMQQKIQLRYSCNLTAGGTTQECMKEVNQYYKDLAVNAIKAVGMEFGGVDIITPNITKKVKCGINEINYNPGLRLHYKVTEGEVVKVAVPIMEYIKNKYVNL
jgi:glutathione synthase/RimK-type ligase-like ATP-grasp enzyme